MTRHANVTLVVFGPTPAELTMSRAQLGDVDAKAIEACDVRMIRRVADPGWFDAWRSGSLRAIATKDLGDTSLLDAAEQLHVVSTDVDDPAGHGYLEAAWALARYLVARGATTVLDVHAMVFTAGAGLPAADAPLDVAREVRVVYETDSTRPDQAHAIHTRGMKKFGAPDLVALCSDADVPLISAAISELAETVARGAELGTPRHRVEVMPGVHWVVVPDEHGLGALLQLNNAARVIVDSDGHDLVGVAARLRRAPS
ncbi:MAG: hypothetical protein H0T46_05480 [Deltaproteobacteria bacterium]|nr:hypothetical protein [Deltaproteobacteria bacterium]